MNKIKLAGSFLLRVTCRPLLPAGAVRPLVGDDAMKLTRKITLDDPKLCKWIRVVALPGETLDEAASRILADAIRRSPSFRKWKKTRDWIISKSAQLATA